MLYSKRRVGIQSTLSKMGTSFNQLSVLERRLSYRDFSFSKMTEKGEEQDQHQVPVL